MQNKNSWETANFLFHGFEAGEIFFPKSYLSVVQSNSAKFQFEIYPCQNDRPIFTIWSKNAQFTDTSTSKIANLQFNNGLMQYEIKWINFED